MLWLHHAPVPSSTRREQAAAASRAAREALHGLQEKLHIPHYAMQKTTEGRPFFEEAATFDPPFDFSLTHSTSLAVAAILTDDRGGRSPRIGVDAEPLAPVRTQAHISAFCDRFFGEHEKALVAEANDPQIAFLTVFTRKEAYAKYCGDGLAKHLRATDCCAPDFAARAGVRFITLIAAEHCLSLCLPCAFKDKPTFLAPTSYILL